MFSDKIDPYFIEMMQLGLRWVLAPPVFQIRIKFNFFISYTWAEKPIVSEYELILKIAAAF